MVISKFLKTNSADKYRELVKDLQQQTRTLFYDRMMYEINDALTSILAVCDVEGKDAVPKIKQYIHRINQSLNNTKNFQTSLRSDKKFNISIVLQNLIHIIKDKYKEAKMACIISDIKAPVIGDQSKFEELLLYIFINMFSSPNIQDSEALIELRQKGQDAMITILKDSHVFSLEMIEHVNKIRDGGDFKGSVSITPQGKGIEVIIKIPLQFSSVSVSNPEIKSIHTPHTNINHKLNEVQRNGPKKDTGVKISSNTISFPRLAF